MCVAHKTIELSHGIVRHKGIKLNYVWKQNQRVIGCVCELESNRAHRESHGRASFVPIYLRCHRPSILVCLKRTKEKQNKACFVLGYLTLPLPQIILKKQGRVGSILVCFALPYKKAACSILVCFALPDKKAACSILVCPTTHLIKFIYLFFLSTT